MTVRYADHEEVVDAGDVYYMAPEHTMAAEAGSVHSCKVLCSDFRIFLEFFLRN
jgi:hypothetical protein